MSAQPLRNQLGNVETHCIEHACTPALVAGNDDRVHPFEERASVDIHARWFRG